MDQIFPVTHSILSSPALLADISSDYDIGRAHTCRLWNRRLNDTYLVKTDDRNYVLRVYRAQWRSLTEIRYELDVLAHLEQKGIAVATPLMRNDGTFIRALNAPEGTRYAVLFRYAPGKELSYDEDISIASAYGSAVGIVPLFIAFRHIWVMGVQTGNGQDWGFGWMNDSYFDRALTFLRTWEPEFTIQIK